MVDWLQSIVVKGGRGCSGYSYTFVLLLCIGCAYSVYHVHISHRTVTDDDYSVWRDWECLTPLELLLRKFSLKNILHLWALKTKTKKMMD